MAQHAIRASRAIGHVGEKVVVVDSVYSIKIDNDSTTYLGLGKNGTKPALTVILRLQPEFKFGQRELKGFKMAVLEVTGNIVLVANQPCLIVTKKENIFFFSPAINRMWLTFPETSAANIK